ncbi:hypothetical protein POM88_005499 [Heracleum sosnowskyi]|uniref:Uncharacterized protein n=1 Tax=Heracleum sosnowskyi TaxID=360622 RepID=A0AAD8J3K4_9APIA|nr:hypothetical protein POM88_005499 [Heracleum sosnowskyi]
MYVGIGSGSFWTQQREMARDRTLNRTPEQLLSENVVQHLISHKTFSGNRPSLSLLLPSLSAYNIGQEKVIAKNTKELSVAISESSMADQEDTRQIITPRKRGRPRKVEQETSAEEQEDETDEHKKPKTSDQEDDGQEDQLNPRKIEQEPKQQQPRSSRARRKNKPMKSST